MIKIIVCMKMVMDPELPLSLFKVDREAMKPIPPQGVPLVMNPFDENALEAALRIKDLTETTITVISLGELIPKVLLQKALALGVDEAIALEAPASVDLNPFASAQVLANAIRKMGNYDLIFTGRQAADWDAGLVWAGIAEALDVPSITIARKVEIRDGKVFAERVVEDGAEVLESDMPVLITFGNEGGVLRNISLPSLMKMKKREIPKWSADTVGMASLSSGEKEDLYIPDFGGVNCRFMQGGSPEEMGRNLARRLFEDAVLR